MRVEVVKDVKDQITFLSMRKKDSVLEYMFLLEETPRGYAFSKAKPVFRIAPMEVVMLGDMMNDEPEELRAEPTQRVWPCPAAVFAVFGPGVFSRKGCRFVQVLQEVPGSLPV